MTLAALALAPSALADTARSSNWAGYAAQWTGESFRSVGAAWTQPAASCRPGSSAYSSYWVGLGGFVANSRALEQVGTDADCSRSGRQIPSAWYEIVPGPAYPVPHSVHPGDSLSAGVTVVGHRVTLVLTDATQRWTFRKTLTSSPIDASSAEWIVEAPSVCGQTCQILPLANFGSATFTSATATTADGHTGSVSDPSWDLTKILLRTTGPRLGSGGQMVAGATPTPLGGGGGSFTVSYALVPVVQGLVRELRAARVLATH